MALEFLNDTPQQAFRKLERDLRLVNPKMDLRQYKNMTPRALGEELVKLNGTETAMLHEQTYGAWLTDDKYVEHRLLKEAITFLKDYKEEKKALCKNLIPRLASGIGRIAGMGTTAIITGLALDA